MAEKQPRKIGAKERQARLRRCRRIAEGMGFTGQVEYRHVFSTSGGAQYGIGTTPEEDLLTVYAEAFERDADPEEFSLAAIIAHERGHQIMCRHSGLTQLIAVKISLPTEEILASLLGSLLVETVKDREDLTLKALAGALERGIPPDDAERLVADLQSILEKLI